MTTTTNVEEGKRCVTCAETKPLTEFERRGDGYRGQCRQCRRAVAARYRAVKGDSIRAYHREWTAAHPDETRDYRRRYREANRQEMRRREWLAKVARELAEA